MLDVWRANTSPSTLILFLPHRIPGASNKDRLASTEEVIVHLVHSLLLYGKFFVKILSRNHQP